MGTYAARRHRLAVSTFNSQIIDREQRASAHVEPTPRAAGTGRIPAGLSLCRPGKGAPRFHRARRGRGDRDEAARRGTEAFHAGRHQPGRIALSLYLRPSGRRRTRAPTGRLSEARDGALRRLFADAARPGLDGTSAGRLSERRQQGGVARQGRIINTFMGIWPLRPSARLAFRSLLAPSSCHRRSPWEPPP